MLLAPIDDFGAAQLFNRSWTMTEKLAATLPAEDVGPALERLRGEFAVVGGTLRPGR